MNNLEVVHLLSFKINQMKQAGTSTSFILNFNLWLFQQQCFYPSKTIEVGAGRRVFKAMWIK